MSEQDAQITQDGNGGFIVTLFTNGYGGGTPVSLFMTMEQMRRLRAALEEAGA